MLMDKTMFPCGNNLRSGQKTSQLEALPESPIDRKSLGPSTQNDIAKVFKIYIPAETKQDSQKATNIPIESTKARNKGGRPRKKAQQLTLEEAVNNQLDDSIGSVNSDPVKPLASKKPKKKKQEEIKEEEGLISTTTAKVSKRQPKVTT